MGIEYINKNSENSLDWTVAATLRKLADDIDTGKLSYNKCFVCLLDDTNDEYATGYRMAGMRGREALTLLDINKSDLMNAILGLPSAFD